MGSPPVGRVSPSCPIPHAPCPMPARARIECASTMERFVVEGGRRLQGSIRPGGNKNAALPILAACLLTDDPIVLRNLPDIQDVRVMLQIIEGLGGSVERLETNVVRIQVKGECSSDPDIELSKKIR